MVRARRPFNRGKDKMMTVDGGQRRVTVVAPQEAQKEEKGVTAVNPSRGPKVHET